MYSLLFLKPEGGKDLRKETSNGNPHSSRFPLGHSLKSRAQAAGKRLEAKGRQD